MLGGPPGFLDEEDEEDEESGPARAAAGEGRPAGMDGNGVIRL